MRSRAYLLAAALFAGLVGGGLFISLQLGSAAQTRVFDRRCRGGCTDTALLRILQGGAVASQLATGNLTTTKGVAVTDTRASNKTCNASATGGYSFVTLGSNQICTEALGILPEPPSTNLALYSEQLQQTAQWTTIGSVTAPVVTADQFIAPNGTLTADQVVFPAVASGNYSLVRSVAMSTTAGTAYTYSALFYSVAGTTIYISANTANYTTCVVPAAAWTRCADTRTVGGTTQSVDIGYNVPATGVGPGNTVYLWGLDFEAQNFVTSYIPTTTTSAARVADVITVANPLPNSGAAWCYYSTITPEGGRAWGDGVSSVDHVLGSLGGANTTYGQIAQSAAIQFNVTGNTSTLSVTNAHSFTAGSTHRIGHCYAPGPVITNYFDGVAQPNTPTGSDGVMTAQNSPIYIGSYSSGFQARAWISDICVGPPGACR